MNLETRTGQLFDLGPDGLGFIADAADSRIWAFRYPQWGADLAPNLKALLKLDGTPVKFTVEAGRIRSIERNMARSSHA